MRRAGSRARLAHTGSESAVTKHRCELGVFEAHSSLHFRPVLGSWSDSGCPGLPTSLQKGAELRVVAAAGWPAMRREVGAKEAHGVRARIERP